MQVRELTDVTPDLLAQIGELRVRAWQDSQPAFRDLKGWVDAIDHRARHWVIEADDQIVAAARLSFHQSRDEIPDSNLYGEVSDKVLRPELGAMNRLVVHPRYQGKRYSAALDQVRIAAAEKAGCRTVVLVAKDRRRAQQLERLGFRVVDSPMDTDPLFVACRVALMVRHFD